MKVSLQRKRDIKIIQLGLTWKRACDLEVDNKISGHFSFRHIKKVPCTKIYN